MDEFELELKQGFLEESAQLLEEAEQAFLNLDTNRGESSIIEEIFRLAHNLKGSSRAVGFGEIAEFTHKMENLILKLKEGELQVTDSVVTVLLKCNDHIRMMVDGLIEDMSARFDSVSLISEIESAIAGDGQGESVNHHDDGVADSSEEEGFDLSDVASMQQLEDHLDENMDVSISSEAASSLEAVLEEVVAEFEAPPISKSTVAQPKASVPGKTAEGLFAAKNNNDDEDSENGGSSSLGGGDGKKAAVDESIRVSLSRLEKLNNFVGELVILQSVLNQHKSEANSPIMLKSLSHLAKLSKEIHNMSMSLRMMPIKTTIKKMQRIVRDTCVALNKDVQLHLVGEETEVDKTVIEHLNDPLVHIVRNAVDHGMELPAEREAAGKKRRGNVTIRCLHEGNNLVIEVIDDGNGINPDIIRKKAIEKGVISERDNLSDHQLVNLIFHPGFSTKDQVSEISGRGVGMDVVKTNIQRISGQIMVDSAVGKGSTFRIVLPLTLAIIEGMVVKVGNEKYVVPLLQIHETVQPEPGAIDYVTGVGSVLNLRGETLPLMDMTQILNRGSRDAKRPEELIAIISRPAGQPFAVLVDDIFHQQQIVVKKLGSEVSQQNLQGFMGSSILGDGLPALILDLHELGNMYKKTPKSVQRTA